MIINHPLLGPRDAAELFQLGDTSLTDRPGSSDPQAVDSFYEYQYLLDNPAGQHKEMWHHEQDD